MDRLDSTESKLVEQVHAPSIEGVEIIQTLAQGGMSFVYKARQSLLERVVAVKVLSAQELGETGIKRFAAEAKHTAALDHPNIVHIHSHGITGDGEPYLIMEYIEGISLSEQLSRTGPLRLDQAVKIFAQLADALSYAHKMGIIHRDVKPANIMLQNLDSEPIAKLLDFGIAKFFEQDGQSQKLTQTGTLIGSPAYMSPEQCAGTPLDSRTDQYSLACVIYEALTGAAPFSGKTTFDVMYKHAHEPPAQEPLKRCCGSAAAAIIAKAMSKNRKERFGDIDEFRVQFEKAVATYRAPHSIPKRHQRTVLFFSVICLLCAVGLLVASFGRMNTAPKKKHSVKSLIQDADATKVSAARQRYANRKCKSYTTLQEGVNSLTQALKEAAQDDIKQQILYRRGEIRRQMAEVSPSLPELENCLKLSIADWQEALKYEPNHSTKLYGELIHGLTVDMLRLNLTHEAAALADREMRLQDPNWPAYAEIKSAKELAHSELSNLAALAANSGGSTNNHARDVAWALFTQIAKTSPANSNALIAKEKAIILDATNRIDAGTRTQLACSLGSLIGRHRQEEEAITFMKKAMAVIQNQKDVTDQNLASCHFYLALLYWSNSQLPQAKEEIALLRQQLKGREMTDPTYNRAFVEKIDNSERPDL